MLKSSTQKENTYIHLHYLSKLKNINLTKRHSQSITGENNNMRTVRTKVYKFNELSEQAKENAVNEHLDINIMFDWWINTYEDAENIGLKITGFDIDRGSYVQGKFTLSACEVAQNISNEHGETCATYKTAESFMQEWQPIFNNYMDENHADYESNELEDKLTDMEDDFLKSICEDYLIILRHEYEYLTSEESIKESIINNEFEFTVDGNRF